MRSKITAPVAFWPHLALTLLGAFFILTLSACQPANNAVAIADKPAIEAKLLSILDKQDDAWSAGDIDTFMETYWMSPDLRFASGGKVSHGWEATRDGYYTRYPNPDIMGRLISGDYEVDVLSPTAAVVHGSWKLEREGEPASGLYTLIFKKIDGEWLITSDTTTSANLGTSAN